MTMKRYTGIRSAGAFVDPVPAAIMKARQMNLDDPNHAHFCVLQTGCKVEVLRHIDTCWQVLYSTRGEEEKKTFLRQKYH